MNQRYEPTSSQFVLYQDDNGITNINVRFDGEDIWLSQQQIAMLFDTTQQNVSQHIGFIIEDGELAKEATHKDFLLVRQENSRSVRRQIEHYNLAMIIAVGYRVKSQIARALPPMGDSTPSPNASRRLRPRQRTAEGWRQAGRCRARHHAL